MKNPLYAKADDVREYLAELIERLDELDEVEYFGHEGWRNMLMGDFTGDYDGGS